MANGLPAATPDPKQVFHPKSGGIISKTALPAVTKTPNGPNVGAKGV